eukprot:25528-Eustigmatos_ZCMA.PRE.1
MLYVGLVSSTKADQPKTAGVSRPPAIPQRYPHATIATAVFVRRVPAPPTPLAPRDPTLSHIVGWT